MQTATIKVILFLTSKLPKGVAQAVIGVSLSKPHTSATLLSICVYLARYVAIYACLNHRYSTTSIYV